jgi:hypothetical protein
MQIGWVPNPKSWERWPEAEALLKPAAARGDFKDVLDPDELLWAVLDGEELLAAATAWLSTDGYVEVKLVGGRDHRRWLKQLDEEIGKAAREAGATRLIAIGRRGWLKSISALGWAKISETDPQTWVFARQLESAANAPESEIGEEVN